MADGRARGARALVRDSGEQGPLRDTGEDSGRELRLLSRLRQGLASVGEVGTALSLPHRAHLLPLSPGLQTCYPSPPPALAESVVQAEPAPRGCWLLVPSRVSSGFFRVPGPLPAPGRALPRGAAEAQGLRGPRGVAPRLSLPGGFRSGVLGGPAPGPCPPAGRASPRRVFSSGAARPLFPTLCVVKVEAGSQAVHGRDPPPGHGSSSRTQH